MGTYSFVAQTGTDKTKARGKREKATETMQAFKKYTAEQRDEAVKKARKP